ncbi:hypothetical protein N7475_005905 [Penicillium sp. IBT 31633x]|nr:hypothetical protein N7475_005905 [Penicillium sp. IBT 31633x]
MASDSSRALLIPHKRALLPPPRPASKVCKVLNPSATPAETRIKQSHDEATQKKNRSTNSSADKESISEDEEDYETPRFEVSFSMPPQPFLDPPTWETMLKRSRDRLAAKSVADAQDSETGQAEESVERRRQQVESEMEYGSMAIRGRSSVRGRGKRGRGRGNVYWGGRH